MLCSFDHNPLTGEPSFTYTISHVRVIQIKSLLLLHAPQALARIWKQTLLAEKERLAALLKDTDKRVENWLEIAERGFNFAEKAAAVFAEAKENDDIETRKEIFASLGSDLILKDKILSIDWDNLLFPIQTMSKEVRVVHAELEPPKNLVNTTDYSELYSQNPVLLHMLHEVRTYALVPQHGR